MRNSLQGRKGLPETPVIFILVSSLIFWLFHYYTHPIGWDGFYYALQLEAWKYSGDLLFRDSSPVFPFLGFLNEFLDHPALTAHLVTSLSFGIYAVVLWSQRLGRNKQYSESALNAPDQPFFGFYSAMPILLLGLLNLISLYFGLEFLKNQLAMVPFFLGILGVQKGKGIPLILGFSSLIFSLWFHKIHWVLVPVVLLFLFIRWIYNQRITQYRFLHLISRMDLLLRLIFPGGILLFYFLWPGSQQSFFTVLQSPISLWEKATIYFLQYILPVFLCFLALVLRPKLQERGPVKSLSLLWFGLAVGFALPILGMDFNQLSFRLLILSPLFYTAGFLSLKKKNASQSSPRIFLGIAILGATLGSYILGFGFHQNKYPNYPQLAEEFSSIREITMNRPIIVHRGLASLLWYEFGQRAENFIPPVGREKYLRLVKGLRYDLFRNLEGAPTDPIWQNERYILIEESLWILFEEKHRGKNFLQSDFNPNIPRPSTGYSLNEAVAASFVKRDQLNSIPGPSKRYFDTPKVHP
jgi:hypothetical protein